MSMSPDFIGGHLPHFLGCAYLSQGIHVHFFCEIVRPQLMENLWPIFLTEAEPGE